jgi:hypothetical protein
MDIKKIYKAFLEAGSDEWEQETLTAAQQAIIERLSEQEKNKLMAYADKLADKAAIAEQKLEAKQAAKLAKITCTPVTLAELQSPVTYAEMKSLNDKNQKQYNLVRKAQKQGGVWGVLKLACAGKIDDDLFHVATRLSLTGLNAEKTQKVLDRIASCLKTGDFRPLWSI